MYFSLRLTWSTIMMVTAPSQTFLRDLVLQIPQARDSESHLVILTWMAGLTSSLQMTLSHSNSFVTAGTEASRKLGCEVALHTTAMAMFSLAWAWIFKITITIGGQMSL